MINKICGIYIIYNKKNKSIYIGQSIDVDARIKTHIRRLKQKINKSNDSENSYLFNSVKKYGINNFKFQIYKKCKGNELTYNEQWLCDFFRSINWIVYNFRECVDSNKGVKFSKETSLKMSKSLKGKKAWNKGKKNIYSKETISKMSISATKRKSSEETKQKISKLTSGENNPNAKLNLNIVEKIRQLWLTKKYTQKQLSNKYNVSIGCIKGIITNRTWYNLNYIYIKRIKSKSVKVVEGKEKKQGNMKDFNEWIDNFSVTDVDKEWNKILGKKVKRIKRNK